MIKPDILCIGSVLWDIIGRTGAAMHAGADVPGRIHRIPGGVAMNIAMTLAELGLKPAVLSAVGRDTEGDELIKTAQAKGLITDALYRSDVMPTDVYMAIEHQDGLIAAIADAHSLELAGSEILTPLANGTLGSEHAPWTGPIAVDGNLTHDLLSEIAKSPLFAQADLRIATASPGKAERLSAFLGHPSATLYVNLEEAGILCHTTFTSATDAATALVNAGVHRAFVTNGSHLVGEAMRDGDKITLRTATPPSVKMVRVTGAGDTFMATQIVSELQGQDPQTALERALKAAANYVAGGSAT